MTPEQVTAKNDKIEYRVYMALNLTIFLIAVAFAVAFIVNVFKANWSYALGFAILAYGVWWVFRRVPWPKTTAEKQAEARRRELVALMSRFSQYR
jgi:O-antigen/teichoic acid export membrane protein